MTTATETKAPKRPTPADAAPPRKFHRWLPWAIAAFFGLWVVGSLRGRPEKSAFNIREAGRLPVVLEGRVQPLDSVARNNLLVMRSKSTVAIDPEKDVTGLAKVFATKRMSAMEWLLEMMTRPEVADERKIFRIDHPELKSLLKLPEEDKHFSLNQIMVEREPLRKEAQRLMEAQRTGKIEAEQRTPFERAVVRLHSALTVYIRLKSSLQPENAENFAAEIDLFDRSIKPGIEALKKSQAGEDYKEEDLQLLAQAFRRFGMLEEIAYPLIIPPVDPSNKDGWLNIGASLKDSMRSGSVHPAAKAYSKMATAYAKNKPEDFNAAVAEYQAFLKGPFAKQLRKGEHESFFNHAELFIKSLTIYLVAFLFGSMYWIRWTPWLRSTGMLLGVLGLVIHTFGLIFRMYLEGRPPVTNLYSSAIFVGWGAVILGLILERIFKDGIGLITASTVGFLTLVIAHNLSLDGDTMKLLQAVLDTNIWLATHVVIITLGYSAMFLAGFLAIIYVLRGLFTSTFSPASGKGLTRMVYGIACFATLASFVGTVLGGIWADQSWGRFWGWDPKENGALLIVIWCAVILHARWGGMIKERGLMAMAIFGNVITAFSWFGVNMLGVGLHAYGFMDQAFKWLIGFVISQIVLMILAMLPVSMWKSPPGGSGGDSSKSRDREPASPGPEQLVPAK